MTCSSTPILLISPLSAWEGTVGINMHAHVHTTICILVYADTVELLLMDTPEIRTPVYQICFLNVNLPLK